MPLYVEVVNLQIDRHRCITTDVLEMLSCLGLEAAQNGHGVFILGASVGFFLNQVAQTVVSVPSGLSVGKGSLSQSLGVNNACCVLLVDHMAKGS